MSILTENERDRYAMLNAIDAKSAGLLQISAILIVFLFLPAVRDAGGDAELLNLAAALLFIAIPVFMVSLLFAPRVNQGLVSARKGAFALAWFLQFAGVVITIWVFFQRFDLPGL